MKNRIAVLSFIALVAVSSLPSLEVGAAAPPFANPDLAGTFVMSSGIIGKSWVLIDFFATWCEPCKKELPELDAIYKTFGERGLVFLVFAVDQEGKDKVAPFFAQTPITGRVLIDRYAVTHNRYEVDGIPSVFLVDPSGKIVFKQKGFSEESIAQLRRILEAGLPKK
jgi:thiol-disulfide isomerase/thioredoxin